MRKAAGVDRSKSSTPRPHRRRPPAASPLVRPTLSPSRSPLASHTSSGRTRPCRAAASTAEAQVLALRARMDGIVTPIAILLVVSSSKGNTIPFRWPPRPSRRQRTEQPDWKTSQGAINGSAFGGGWNAGRRARCVLRPAAYPTCRRPTLTLTPASTITCLASSRASQDRAARAPRTITRPSSLSSRGRRAARVS
jgi:hypothetical protein